MLNPHQFGFRSDHKKWWDVEKHREHEIEELGNDFPDVSDYPNHEGIWVTHTENEAKRYGDNIYQVDLKGAKPIHHDNDGGYFYVRPKPKLK